MLWKWYSFKDFTNEELYDVLQLRQEIFVVEQDCAYLDCDGLDKICLHLVGWQTTGKKFPPVAYLRIVPPQSETKYPAIGRVLIHPNERATGLGRKLMKKCLAQLHKLYPDRAIRISAQQYLIDFYGSLGFQPSSEMYLEDGIPHLEMILKDSHT